MNTYFGFCNMARQKTFHIVYAEILLRVIQDHSYQQYITIVTSKFSSLVPYSILLDMTFLTTPITFSCKVLFGSKIKMHTSFSIFQTISNDCGPKCLPKVFDQIIIKIFFFGPSIYEFVLQNVYANNGDGMRIVNNDFNKLT